MLKVFDFEKTPIVDIVNEILVDASSRGASDIHFDPKDNILQIRIRIDGSLVDYATVPEEYIKNLITRIKIISGMNITESRLPQDGSIKGVVKNIELDLRVSSINTNKGEKIVIRILDYTLSLNGIEKLGFTDYNYKKVLEMISKPNGIILVTGATGTGKTTTVYSMLQRLSNDTTNIMSIEDPVEMDLDNVNQIQVNADIGLTFATALRSILRQDPNIIMIGEIRDSETATIAIRASVTGHLVLSTLHTNDSLSTIERLMDMDVEKYLLAEALEGIISQRLARRLCPHCKKLRNTTTYEKDLIKKTLNIDVDEIYEAVGCEHCNRGYKGRIAFQEVLTIDQKIQDALSMNIRKDKLRNLVYNDTVITLLQDGMIKVVRGDTTIEELLRLVEFEEDSIVTFNLSKDILDSELAKTIEYQEDINETKSNDANVEEENIIEDEIIVPDASDVVIDSIDENDDEENIDIDNTDIDKMDVLDNDEEFIDKIDEVITEKEEKKKSRLFGRKKDKKKKDKEPQIETEEIIKESNTNDTVEDNTTETIEPNEESISEAENDLDNMESLDNDEEFTNKIDKVITEDDNNDDITIESVEEKLDTNTNTNDNDNEVINDEILTDDINLENSKDKEKLIDKPKKKKKGRKKKKEKEIQAEVEDTIIDENTSSELLKESVTDTVEDDKTNLELETDTENIESLDNNNFTDNIDEVITPTEENIEKSDNKVEKDVIEIKDESKGKSKKKIKKKEKQKNKEANDDINANTNISDTLIDSALAEIKSNNDDIDNSDDNIINDDSTFITKVENLVNNKKAKDKEIDIIDEISENNDSFVDTNTSNEKNQNEITDNDIAELEEAIESIKTNEKEIEEDKISNDEEIENTIKISINNDDATNDEINVSEVKTVNMVEKDDHEMDTLDYNTNFIDKIYDSINNEKRVIEKDNIDYEKIERLEDIQDEIGSRVSRMLNKKRYRKIKKDE